MKAAICLICLTLSACSYTRDEPVTQLQIDDAQCRAQAASVAWGEPLQIMMVRRLCMEGKGYK